MPLKVFSFSYCQDHHTRNRNPIEHRPTSFGIYGSYKINTRDTRLKGHKQGCSHGLINKLNELSLTTVS